MVKTSSSYKDALLSALLLALANMGDAFLYAYLPANYKEVGLSAFWVGIILSINRFTRLFLNGRVAWFLNSKGIKIVLLLSGILAALTTISYGFISAFPLWILARIIWGISFSTLRLGNTLFALENPKKGFAMGMSRAVIELGPVIALLIGPILLEFNGRFFTFLTFGLISLVAILLVLPLNNLQTENVTQKELKLSRPSSFNVLVLINAFIAEGLLVVLLGRLILNDTLFNSFTPLALIGLLLGYRRLSLVFLAPLSGWLGDKLGYAKVFIYTTALSALGLTLILFGLGVVGILSIFTFSAINAAVATIGAMNSKYSNLKNASDNATWRDIGTAVGAFTGALLLGINNVPLLLILLLLLYALGLIYHHLKPTS